MPMERPTANERMRAVAAVALLATLAMGGAIASTWSGSVDVPEPMDQRSYWAGWAYVTNRQPDESVAPWLRTDGGIVRACAAYADGFAQLDGYPDGPAVLLGCRHAAERTRLEVGPS